jgi:hypothetical protein
MEPEGLYREPHLMAPVIVCTEPMTALMLVDVPMPQVVFNLISTDSFG